LNSEFSSGFASHDDAIIYNPMATGRRAGIGYGRGGGETLNFGIGNIKMNLDDNSSGGGIGGADGGFGNNLVQQVNAGGGGGLMVAEEKRKVGRPKGSWGQKKRDEYANMRRGDDDDISSVATIPLPQHILKPYIKPPKKDKKKKKDGAETN
jgi:hypothetical protein